MDCCGVGVCGPYILLNGLDDINDDAEDGGGVMCDDCLLKIPAKTTISKLSKNRIHAVTISI